MNTFYLVEIQGDGLRTERVKIVSVSLKEAKRRASYIQQFQGAILELKKRGKIVAIKDKGRWIYDHRLADYY